MTRPAVRVARSAEDRERLARAYLLTVDRPDDRDLTDLVCQFGPALAAELVAASSGGHWEPAAVSATEECRKAGLRLVMPGDAEWPGALNADPWRAPLALWVGGGGRLDDLARRAVGIAGRTDATPYGIQVAAELGRRLARAGWTVVTLGRVGIDSAALRGALQDRPVSDRADAPRAVVAPPMALPFGRLVQPQPYFHEGLFRRVGWDGVLLGEHGANVPAPHHRTDAHQQIRLLVALVAAVAVVEPSRRGWGDRLARTAADARRPVLAVPGPVTSEGSGFSHELVRTARARLVTGADQLLSELDALLGIAARPPG